MPVALVAFSLLLIRLWSLQVLAGPHYRAMAVDNQQRTLRIEAPRGPILDRRGRVLVTNRPITAIEIWPANLPKRRPQRVIRRLAAVVGLPVAEIARAVAAGRADQLNPVVVREAVSEEKIRYLLEHQNEFPGVRLSESFVRAYPRQSLAAQVLGYVREISPAQLKKLGREGYASGDQVGQSGVEAAYDGYLRGQDGSARLRVDAFGHPSGRLLLSQTATTGSAVRLTIDVDLQRAAEQALRLGIDRARENKNWYANGGAIVALDPRDGGVLAMASYPTYKPSVYAGRVDPRKLAPLANATRAHEANYPGLNRNLQALYPPGSTFKSVTALAAMQEHLVEPYAALPCTPSVTIAKQVFRNWNPAMSAQMTLPTALAASCDTYFYRLGYSFYKLPPSRGQPLQEWASRFGFGTPTGIDIGGEEHGLLPTIKWRERTYTKKSDPCCWAIDRLWKPGDSIQLAIGQKDMLVTPLQMARFYALIANGGRLVTPHLMADVEPPNTSGGARVSVRAPVVPPKTVGVDPTALEIVRRGLLEATHSAIGTSTGVFGAFPVPVAGKTGTAEKVVDVGPETRLLSQSWWCGYAPAGAPTIALCAVIENGGFGGEAAAPAALKVLQKYFGVAQVRQDSVPSD